MRITNRIKCAWIVFWSLIRCFRTFAKSILRVALGQMDRAMADRYILEWATGMLNIVKVKIKINGASFTPNPARATIYMCNHASLYDIPISFVALPGSVRMLAKKELSKVFMFGRVLRENEFFFIDRANRHKAIEDLTACAQKLRSGIVAWVAPEGTRSPTGELLPFKKGVFKLAKDTEAIIVPIGIIGANRLLPAKTLDFNPAQTVTVNIGKPIDTMTYEENNLAELMSDVRSSMEELLRH